MQEYFEYLGAMYKNNLSSREPQQGRESRSYQEGNIKAVLRSRYEKN